VVVGVGFLVGYVWGRFPNILRVAILYASGAATLAGGIFLERTGRYKALGRSLIGGGWAVLVLVTYALANTASLHVLDSREVDLFLLLGVIGAMVWHTLRYASQIVTGAGFLLGFVAIAMNPSAPYNLIAGAMLISGMTLIVLRYHWWELEIFGILAAYINHFYWLYRVYEQQGQRAVFPHHAASVALVIACWAIFRASYLARKISGSDQETISTNAGIMNPLFFLAVMKYQGFHPEWAWKVLLVMGAVEFTLGQLPVSRRRKAPFHVLSSLGAALMVAAIPFRYSGNSLDLIWLAGAEVFLLAGIFQRERLFRAFGVLISVLIVGHALVARVFPIFVQIVGGQTHRDAQLTLMLAVVAAVLYLNSHVVRRRWQELFAGQAEDLMMSVLSFAASVLAVAAVYVYVPNKAVAVVLALFVAWLSVTGKMFAVDEMIYQAHWVATLAFIQLIVADRDLTALSFGVPQRVLAFSVVAALFYLSSRFVRLSDTAGQSIFYAAYAWGATALIALLIWFQLADWAIAMGWIALALVLSLAGQYLNRADLKWQALALVLLSFGRGLLFNINLTATFSRFTYRLLSISVIAVGTYLLARWSPLKSIRPVYSVAGTTLLAYLAYKETETAALWTAVAWIGLALVLSLGARLWKDRALLWQTHLLGAMAVAWTLYANFDPQHRGTRLQLLTVAITAATFYALTWITNIAEIIESERIAQAYAWAGSLLVSWLAWYQLDPVNVSLAWGVFAVLLYELRDVLGAVRVDVGTARSSWHGQCYVALAGSFAHIFYANFNSRVEGGFIQVLLDRRVFTVWLLAIIYFYIYWRAHSRPAGAAGGFRPGQGGDLVKESTGTLLKYALACLGTATVAALIRFEAEPAWVVAGYAAMVAVLLLVAWRTGQEIFLYQSVVMLGFAGFRMATNNFYHLKDANSASSLNSCIWAIALLAVCVPLAFQIRGNAKFANLPGWLRGLAGRPEQPMFFVPVILLVVLLFLKLEGGKVTLFWGLEGLAIFMVALWARERSFRLTGVALVMLSIGKLGYDTLYFNDPLVRILAWIGIGLVILVVSFLYGKNREALKDYL